MELSYLSAGSHIHGFDGNALMKQIFGWLNAKLPRSKAANDEGASGSPERPEPDKDDLGLPKDMQDLVDDADIATGFNPYDTAGLHKK